MAGKGGKGLVAAKTTAANKDKDKDKKRPISRSSRAGIQVNPPVTCCNSVCIFLIYLSGIWGIKDVATVW